MSIWSELLFLHGHLTHLPHPPATTKVSARSTEVPGGGARATAVARPPAPGRAPGLHPRSARSRLTVVEPIPGGTRVSVVHRGFDAGESAQGHADG